MVKALHLLFCRAYKSLNNGWSEFKCILGKIITVAVVSEHLGKNSLYPIVSTSFSITHRVLQSKPILFKSVYIFEPNFWQPKQQLCLQFRGTVLLSKLQEKQLCWKTFYEPMATSFFSEEAWLKTAVTCDFAFLSQNTWKSCYLQAGGHMINGDSVHWETHHWKFTCTRILCLCFFWQLWWDLDQIKNQCCPLLMENDYFFIAKGMIIGQILWGTPFLPKYVNGPELGCKITLIPCHILQ